MIHRYTCSFLLVLVALLAPLSAAFAADPFYWRDSYGRGVGTAVQANCGSDTYDAGLCYPPCAEGYDNGGPICWKGIQSKLRGVGRVPAYNCGNKEADAGLCYEQCKAGYKGAGPVCWGIGPPGYVECGAGYAVNSGQCALVTGGQTMAVGMLLATVIPAAMEAANTAKQAEMGPEAVEEAGKLAKLMEPVMAKLRPIFEDMGRGADKIAEKLGAAKQTIIDELFNGDKVQAEQIFVATKYLAKYVNGVSSATIQAINGPDGAIDFLRLVTTITGIMDPTPVSGLISSFAYPVYVPHTVTPVAHDQPVVASSDSLYTVAGGALYHYPLQAGGAWGPQRKIGNGWGGLRVVTAGDRGELYALDQKGTLYYYKHDPSLKWQVGGEKIGFGFGAMKTILAGGNFLDQVERRVLFALGNDGTLWYYRFGEANGAITTPYGVQIGWGWSDCAKVFAGTSGVVYCIKQNGQLMRYAYDLRNPRDRTPAGAQVGTGWNAFSRVFAGAGGQIYAVRPNGELLAYRDLGGIVIGPKSIGTGWNLEQTTAMKNR